eukprot:XP_014026043.1 PREDICTED: 2-methoxy-6-polyprenyl-1,4-benzoquinol methylase, mitochondrial isoform X2 [Salmo salar]
MAASIRLLARRIVRDASRTINSSVSGRIVSSSCPSNLSASRCFSDGAADKSTHFGFETVSEGEKAERGDISFRFLDYVRSQRERVARRTARANQTPSWQEISTSYTTPTEGIAMETEARESRAVVCDINKEMLKVGKQKAESMGISSGLSWVVGDAEELPFDDDQFDVYTIAFGIRNVTHIDLALQEAVRVLKPGGRFMCLEFSKVTNPLLARLYDAYSFQMIPVLGEVIAGDWKSYQYLVESIRKFPDQETFKQMIEDAGLFSVRYHNLTGGVVALHSGFKL